MRTSLFLLLLAACGRPEPTSADPRSPAPLTSTPAHTADATIENGLPYDGCSYPVTIDGVDYAPSATSRDRVIAFVGGTGHVPVRVEFQPTGRTAEVTCGWNNTRTLPEIDITSITAK